jgi:hypothetical protein
MRIKRKLPLSERSPESLIIQKCRSFLKLSYYKLHIRNEPFDKLRAGPYRNLVSWETQEDCDLLT